MPLITATLGSILIPLFLAASVTTIAYLSWQYIRNWFLNRKHLINEQRKFLVYREGETDVIHAGIFDQSNNQLID